MNRIRDGAVEQLQYVLANFELLPLPPLQKWFVSVLGQHFCGTEMLFHGFFIKLMYKYL